MILRLVDWYLAQRGERRIPASSSIDVVPFVVLQMTHEAVDLVRRVDAAPQSGEWKKHEVYARMLKLYPQTTKRLVSWAIERAVRETV